MRRPPTSRPSVSVTRAVTPDAAPGAARGIGDDDLEAADRGLAQAGARRARPRRACPGPTTGHPASRRSSSNVPRARPCQPRGMPTGNCARNSSGRSTRTLAELDASCRAPPRPSRSRTRRGARATRPPPHARAAAPSGRRFQLQIAERRFPARRGPPRPPTRSFRKRPSRRAHGAAERAGDQARRKRGDREAGEGDRGRAPTSPPVLPRDAWRAARRGVTARCARHA